MRCASGGDDEDDFHVRFAQRQCADRIHGSRGNLHLLLGLSWLNSAFCEACRSINSPCAGWRCTEGRSIILPGHSICMTEEKGRRAIDAGLRSKVLWRSGTRRALLVCSTLRSTSTHSLYIVCVCDSKVLYRVSSGCRPIMSSQDT